MVSKVVSGVRVENPQQARRGYAMHTDTIDLEKYDQLKYARCNLPLILFVNFVAETWCVLGAGAQLFPRGYLELAQLCLAVIEYGILESNFWGSKR